MAEVLYTTIKRHAEVTGYTEAAIRAKIDRGEWPEGRVWTRAPDGRVLIIIHGYNRWVESGREIAVTKAFVPRQRVVSKSISPIRASAAESGSSSSPAPLT